MDRGHMIVALVFRPAVPTSNIQHPISRFPPPFGRDFFDWKKYYETVHFSYCYTITMGEFDMKCPYCDNKINPGAKFCYKCGTELETEDIVKAPTDFATGGTPLQGGGGSLIGAGVSGDSASVATFPSGNPVNQLKEVTGWNWGAFVFTWIWAFAHRVWLWGVISIIMGFINLGLIPAIVLGIGGNEMAWKARHFNSVKEFREVQRKWAIAGLIVLFFFIILFFFFIFAGRTGNY